MICVMERLVHILCISFLLSICLECLAVAQTTEYDYIDGDSLTAGSWFVVNPDRLMAVEARVAMPKKKDGQKSAPYWGMAWNCLPAGGYDYVALCFGRDGDDDVTGRNCVTVTRGRVSQNCDSVFFSKKIFNGFDFARGYNSLACEWKDGVIYVSGGNVHVDPLFSIPCEKPPHLETFKLISNNSLSVECVVIENKKSHRSAALAGSWNADLLENRFAMSADDLEGYWEYFDLQAEYDNARPGGRYRFAIVRSSERTYDILYMGGASVNSGSWSRLMLKGRLLFTPFQNNYTLEWLDAMFQPVDVEVGANATVVNKSLLSLQFPMYKFTLRLAKVANTDGWPKE